MPFKTFGRLLVDSGVAWFQDNGPRLGASLAFYTVFSLAPALIVVIAVAGLVFGRAAAQGQIVEQIGGLVGREGAATVQAMIESAWLSPSASFATIAGITALVVGASALFAELQNTLNVIWHVKRRRDFPLVSLLKSRLRSFFLVVAIGFLLLVSLVVSAALAAFSGYLEAVIGGTELISMLNFGVSFAVITVLFALLFKVLPDVEIEWKDVWLGAAITAALFNIGKFAIGLYLGSSGIASAYGAAGSLAVILMWIYYSAQILLFGAEFTRLYTERQSSIRRPVAYSETVSKTATGDRPA